MSYKIIATKRFRKELKKYLINKIITKSDFGLIEKLLTSEKKIPIKYKDHALKGEWKGFRECHIKPDVLLVYHRDKGHLILSLILLGSHSELF